MKSDTRLKKPEWLKVSLGGGEGYADIKSRLKKHKLSTVCEEAACPNRGECWNARSLTLMILGEVCPRGCPFCNVTRGDPKPPDPEEPRRVAELIAGLSLNHAVITCVTRDDLEDGGAEIWKQTINWIRKLAPKTSIEALVSDFAGNEAAQREIIAAKPDVLAHNLETVSSQYKRARPAANYERSLSFLSLIAQSGLVAKSGLMVGLGETDDEIAECLNDLAKCGVSIVTIGQYLQPTPKNLSVERFVSPETFKSYERLGLKAGIKQIISGPLVRSSYMAHTYTKILNRG